jgi:hypothetical protein
LTQAKESAQRHAVLLSHAGQNPAVDRENRAKIMPAKRDAALQPAPILKISAGHLPYCKS